jgi:hypothetical protein
LPLRVSFHNTSFLRLAHAGLVEKSDEKRLHDFARRFRVALCVCVAWARPPGRRQRQSVQR